MGTEREFTIWEELLNLWADLKYPIKRIRWKIKSGKKYYWDLDPDGTWKRKRKMKKIGRLVDKILL